MEVKTLLAAAAITAVITGTAQAEMRYPNWFAFEMLALQMNGLNRVPAEPYLRCDYAARTCLKGYAVTGREGVYIFAGALVDGDNRQVELRHLKCFDNFRTCNDYDRGTSWKGGVVEKPDMSPACVELMRTTGRFNSGKEPCLGYGFEDFVSPAQKIKDDAKNDADANERWRISVTSHILTQHIQVREKVRIKIEIDRDGNIKSATEVDTGKDQLDILQITRATTVAGANRLPPPPASINGETVTLIAKFDPQSYQPFITIPGYIECKTCSL
jgi:hypothetical protein